MILFILFIPAKVYPGAISYHQGLEDLVQGKFLLNKKRLYALSLSKTFILNGFLEGALDFLLRMEEGHDSIELTRKRYLATVYFLQGDYKNSLRKIDEILQSKSSYYKQLCFLKLFNFFDLRKLDGLKKEYLKCFSLSEDVSKSDILWTKSIIETLLNPQQNVEQRHNLHFGPTELLNISNDLLITWLKLSIYLNFTKKIEKLLPYIPKTFLKLDRVKEIIGFIYYRLKKWDQAERYVKELNTPNARNILGNIDLFNNNYEQAYDNFFKAFKMKRNSLNAIERLIPLSWTLGKWEEGTSFATRIPHHHGNLTKKLTLLAAFQLKNNNHHQVLKTLIKLEDLYGRSAPKKVNLIWAYNSLIFMNLDNFDKYTEKGCFQYDAPSCSLMLTSSLWPDITKTVKREDPVNDQKEITLEYLKQEATVDPIKDHPLTDPLEIEELDEKQF